MNLYVYIAVRQWGGATVGVIAPDGYAAWHIAEHATGIRLEVGDLRNTIAVADTETPGLKFSHEYDDPTYEG